MRFMQILLTLSMLYSTYAKTLNWAQLRNALASGTLTDLSRTPEIEMTYQEFRINLKEKNLTVPQHVKLNIFGFTGRPKESMHFLTKTNINDMLLSVYVTGPENVWRQFIKKQMQPRAVAGIQEKSQFVLFAINDFPYSLMNINHWVVWSSFEFHTSFQEALLLQILDQNVDRLAFQNPAGLKSIPEINHFQLFWRKKDHIMDQL